MSEDQVTQEDVKRLLDMFNIKVENETTDEYRCKCPLHDDNSPSFSINKHTGKWNCFTKDGGGSLVGLIMRINKCSYEKAKEMFYGKSETTHVPVTIVERKKDVELNNVGLPEEFELITSKSNCPRYLLNRINIDTIKHFGIGKCDTGYFRNRIIVPVRYEGNTMGFVARDYSGNATKPYLFPIGFKSRDYVFNYDSITANEIIAVEGPFDSMSMWEKGFKNNGCIFGINISQKQIEWLVKKEVKSIVLCFDNDVAKSSNYGLIAAKQIANKFKYFFDKICIMQLPGGRDPDECTQLELSMAYRARRIVSMKSKTILNI